MQCYQDLRKYTDLPIVIKKHPNRRQQYNINKLHNVSFFDHTHQAAGEKYLATLSSKMNIASCLYGIPTISADLNSMVHDITSTSNDLALAEQKITNKNDFIQNIFYSIWSSAEMSNGTYINYLMNELLV